MSKKRLLLQYQKIHLKSFLIELLQRKTCQLRQNRNQRKRPGCSFRIDKIIQLMAGRLIDLMPPKGHPLSGSLNQYVIHSSDVLVIDGQEINVKYISLWTL